VSRTPSDSSTSTASKLNNISSNLKKPMLTAGTTVVTLPCSELLLHKEPAVALAVGLVPLAPFVVIMSVAAVMYTVIMTLAVATMAFRGEDPERSFGKLLFWCTNVPIALLTMTPLEEASEQRAETGNNTSIAPSETQLATLPPAEPKKTQAEDTPVYWVSIQEMASAPGGAPDIVPPSEPITTPDLPRQPGSKGRHAKPESASKTRVAAHTG
jgi:hypothetical protein